MDDRLTSRCFRTGDPQRHTLLVPLPAAWWSRPYEYAWAALFAEPGDVVLDAGCGVEHPFKFFLAARGVLVHALDADPRLGVRPDLQAAVEESCGPGAWREVAAAADRLRLQVGDIRRSGYAAESFDRVFCLSVLEHLGEGERLAALQEFHRVLRRGGLLLLTVDFPSASLAGLYRLMLQSGFEPAGDLDFSLPQGAVGRRPERFPDDLYVFRFALRRP